MKLKIGDRVKVYRNLHGPKGQKTYSVLGPNGRVVARVKQIMLTDVTFVVRPAGRDKVRKTGRKNVHAFVVGKYVEPYPGGELLDLPRKISYNPYKNDTFMLEIIQPGYRTWVTPVAGALAAVINQNGISAAYVS